MPKYAVVARDHSVDLYDDQADDFVGCEVVEASDDDDAIFRSEYYEQRWHYWVYAYPVADREPLGEHHSPPKLVG